MKKILFTMLIAMFVFTGCNKDDDANPVSATHQYSYAGKTYDIMDAEYLYADGDTFLFFRGSGTANYVQIIFADHIDSIPTGTFTYNALRYGDSYDPESNFWSGAVTTELNPLGYNLSGGTVTIQPKGGGYEVVFKVTTQEGTAEGSYTGTIRPR